MVAKKRPRDVDCDIVWSRARAAGARCAASPSPPIFVMQIVAPASVLRALPAATTVIIVKNIHLSALRPPST